MRHIQLIAKGLDLPTGASAIDLSVMINGRLQESNHGPSYTQVVITQSEEGEELSLQDMNGVFFRIPALKCTSAKTSTPISEVSVELQDAFALQENSGFSAEEECLEHVLGSMEQGLVKTRTQLLEAQGEITCLRIGISEHRSKLLEVQKDLELERERMANLARENDTSTAAVDLRVANPKEGVKRG